MKPTSIRLLLAIGASGGVVGYFGVKIWDGQTGAPPAVPWASPTLLAFVAAGFFLAVLTLRPRIERRPGHRPLDPFTAARTAALALAGSRAGAAVAGVYGGYVIFLLIDLDNGYRRHLLLIVGSAALAGVAMTVAAFWLERICRIDMSDDDPSSTAAAA